MEQNNKDSPGVKINRHELKRQRHLNGYTRIKLAELSNLSPSYIGLIERGARTTISPPAFARLCDALNITDRNELIFDTAET